MYIWNASTGTVTEFCKAHSEDTPDNNREDESGNNSNQSINAIGSDICSLKWTADGSHLAIGTDNGETQIWDLESSSRIRTMAGHAARVGVLSWDRHLVSSGCKDGSIYHHDVRVRDHRVGELLGHDGEVCGLEWRADGGVLASGGNDNLVNIWDARSSVPKFSKTNHTAAVKVHIQ